jgi:hypothetical protein
MRGCRSSSIEHATHTGGPRRGRGGQLYEPGYKPNRMPTAAAKPKATNTASTAISVRHSAKWPIACAPPSPTAIPSTPPISDSVTASTRNWVRMSRRRADRHPQPDLARPLAHRDQHDVHDPSAPGWRRRDCPPRNRPPSLIAGGGAGEGGRESGVRLPHDPRPAEASR